jgi:hypothetical protein
VARVGRFNKDQQFGAAHPDGAEGGQRDEGEIVLALAEGAPHLLGDADDAEGDPGDGHFLVERVGIGEALVDDFGPDDADARFVQGVGFVQIAAEDDLFASDIDEAGG